MVIVTHLDSMIDKTYQVELDRFEVYWAPIHGKITEFWENAISPCPQELWSSNFDSRKTQKYQISQASISNYDDANLGGHM